MISTLSHAPETPFVPQPAKVMIQAPAPVSPWAIRARDPSMPVDLQEQILEMQYREVTLKDAAISGNATYNDITKSWTINSKRPEPSFKGLVFEATIARMCREEPFTVGKSTFAWCTNRRMTQVTQEMITEYVPFITADRSLLDIKLTASFYNPSSPYDLHFYRVNAKGSAELATQNGTGVIAGLQVKAIQGNERQEIIDPLISGRYFHVLTMLEHPSGEHSYEVCKRILLGMLDKGEITSFDYTDVSRRITYPQALGIQQSYINDYSEYISVVFRNGGLATQDMSAAVALEVTGDYALSSGGILVPDNQLVLPTLH